jgi:hypothetical protein
MVSYFFRIDYYNINSWTKSRTLILIPNFGSNFSFGMLNQTKDIIESTPIPKSADACLSRDWPLQAGLPAGIGSPRHRTDW